MPKVGHVLREAFGTTTRSVTKSGVFVKLSLKFVSSLFARVTCLGRYKEILVSGFRPAIKRNEQMLLLLPSDK